MLKWSCVLILGLSFIAGRASAAEEWAVKHPEARARLLKIFEKHAGFREALVEYSIEHHATFASLVDFLAKKHEHTVSEFIRLRDKEDKETPALTKIHEKYKDGFEDFKEFVHDHHDAALALTVNEHELEHLDRVAEKRGEK